MRISDWSSRRVLFRSERRMMEGGGVARPMNELRKIAGSAMEPAADDRRTAAEAGIRDLLRAVGEDPDRDGLRETPARVVRAFAEYCAGYAQDRKSTRLNSSH